MVGGLTGTETPRGALGCKTCCRTSCELWLVRGTDERRGSVLMNSSAFLLSGSALGSHLGSLSSLLK